MTPQPSQSYDQYMMDQSQFGFDKVFNVDLRDGGTSKSGFTSRSYDQLPASPLHVLSPPGWRINKRISPLGALTCVNKRFLWIFQHNIVSSSSSFTLWNLQQKVSPTFLRSPVPGSSVTVVFGEFQQFHWNLKKEWLLKTFLYEFTANGSENFPNQIPGCRLNSSQMHPDFMLTKEGNTPPKLKLATFFSNPHSMWKLSEGWKAFCSFRIPSQPLASLLF